MTEYKLVPVEPTEEMLKAVSSEGEPHSWYRSLYREMLAAAPEPATPAPTSVQDGQTTPLEVAAPLPDDLIKRLRTMAGIGWNPIGDEAADMLERLARENESIKNDLGQQLLDAAKTITAVKAERDELENNLDSCASECLGLRQTLKDDSSFWRYETARANKIVKHCKDALKECLRQLVCCHQDVEIVHAERVTRDALLKIEEYYKS